MSIGTGRVGFSFPVVWSPAMFCSEKGLVVMLQVDLAGRIMRLLCPRVVVVVAIVWGWVGPGLAL